MWNTLFMRCTPVLLKIKSTIIENNKKLENNKL
jgi:hypothetical protein